ncbi:hypothetical protein FOL47_008860 [Perkinsus chesapeaki]|uniref:Uncharacterized protein n=1 Tax=Perkinsus chesapeaki TaxID=330153 RepID=A0A7J6MTW2_PERCH|nr:hypothetical protein FOL47_008860 [Perkinsus chesapeaki]
MTKLLLFLSTLWCIKSLKSNTSDDDDSWDWGNRVPLKEHLHCSLMFADNKLTAGQNRTLRFVYSCPKSILTDDFWHSSSHDWPSVITIHRPMASNTQFTWLIHVRGLVTDVGSHSLSLALNTYSHEEPNLLFRADIVVKGSEAHGARFLQNGEPDVYYIPPGRLARISLTALPSSDDSETIVCFKETFASSGSNTATVNGYCPFSSDQINRLPRYYLVEKDKDQNVWELTYNFAPSLLDVGVVHRICFGFEGSNLFRYSRFVDTTNKDWHTGGRQVRCLNIYVTKDPTLGGLRASWFTGAANRPSSTLLYGLLFLLLLAVF